MPRSTKHRQVKPLRLRRFLNAADNAGDAIVSIKVNTGSTWDDFIRVKITDCERVVVLHNEYDTMKARGNALYKLRTLRDAFDEALSHLEAETKRLKMRVHDYA